MARESQALPPGIPLPGLIQTLVGVWWMDRFEEYVRRGPKTRTLKVLGLGEVVTLSDPADLQKVFTASPDVVRAAEINARILRGLGSGSIMHLDGEEHLRMRRLLLPPFHGEAVKAYAQLFEEITAEEIESWPEDRELAAHPAMQRIALESILRAVIGVASESRRADRLRAVLPKVLQANPITFLA